jgi:rSAM/selenodomain-associated transferase 1
MTRGPVVYVVAKAPRAGVSKARLCPPLSARWAARLAEAFLLDVLETVRRAGCAARIVCRDAGEQAALEQIAGDVYVSAQPGAGLGDALEWAFREGLDDGYSAVGVLGADSPTLPADVLVESFDVLDRAVDVGLGPSEDGGYYLLTAREVHSGLFREMIWSTATVAAETLARCVANRLTAHLLPEWYDVDDFASLQRLSADLLAAPPSLAPRTREVLVRAISAEPLTVRRLEE